MTTPGPMCECGHVLYSHYMCGLPQKSRCFACACKQFSPAKYKQSIAGTATIEKERPNGD